MASKRLIDANALLLVIEEELSHESPFFTAEQNEMIDCGLRIAATDIRHQPTVDAVEVVRIEEVKREMLQTLDTIIAKNRDISNSQFSNYEKHLDIPKSSNDYYGICADVMEIARRLVNAALTDLCDNGGAKMDGGNEDD